MKKILPLLLSMFMLSGLYAQNDCSGGRFYDPIHPVVSVLPAVPFGAGEVSFDTVNSGGVVRQPLFMDIYQPVGDLAIRNRPVIVWAFGGAFVYGARVSPDIVELSTRYAQMGYVCVSIDYRLSDELLVNPSPENATKAVLKGTQDMKAALRFLYRTVLDSINPFGIDTNQIYVGGVSAGAFCALHSSYLDDDEVPEILQEEYDRTGGVEGTSGNAGFSSKVAGVINLCGALGEKEWLDFGDVPIVSMHGTEDDVVPYDEDTVRILGINYPVAGSAAIHRRANELGIVNDFYTFKGAGHVPFVGDAAYMDTTFRFTREFMYGQVCAGFVNVNEAPKKKAISVYPNPVNHVLNLDMNLEDIKSLVIYNADGRVIYYSENLSNKQINTQYWSKGVYTLKLELTNGELLQETLVK